MSWVEMEQSGRFCPCCARGLGVSVPSVSVSLGEGRGRGEARVGGGGGGGKGKEKRKRWESRPPGVIRESVWCSDHFYPQFCSCSPRVLSRPFARSPYPRLLVRLGCDEEGGGEA